jgi:hypothetical protein
MTIRATTVFFILFIVVVAPLGTIVFVSALLLFGMKPQTVFAPGWAVMSLLRTLGIHAPNAAGVAVTGALWWALLIGAGLVWERRRARRIPDSHDNP